MKVNIGPHINWIGPYQIADRIFFWQDKYSDTCPWAKRAYALGSWLSTNKDGTDSRLLKFCEWIQSKRHRKLDVQIDAYDTWSMDYTLAHIVLPMLKQLKATKHGAAQVEDTDVPLTLQSTAPGAKDRCEDEHDLDEHWFTRWDWVLDEMIWAFEQKIDDNSDNQFFDHGTPIVNETFEESISRIKVDYEGLKAHNARKANGFRLFGKYYEALWD
jgi:hypothetical protein